MGNLFRCKSAPDVDYDGISTWIHTLKRGYCSTKGLPGSKCYLLRISKNKTKYFNGLFKKPIQWLWVLEKREWNPERPQSISHLCGENNCINLEHCIKELLAWNTSRESCHTAIQKWLDNHGGVQIHNHQYTVAMCVGITQVCKHTKHPCFKSTGSG